MILKKYKIKLNIYFEINIICIDIFKFVRLYGFFLLIHQNLEANSGAPKSSYQSQKQPVLSPVYLILYQWTKFQCHTFFTSQDIKQNVLLSSYLDSQ